MSDRYLHESERLLVNRRSSPALLIAMALRGLLEGLLFAMVLGAVLVPLTGSLEAAMLPWAILGALAVAGIVAWRVRRWRHATLRVTTERILVEDPRSFFHAPMKTIKWSQFQECEVGHRMLLDLFFLARPLRIRYGTADAKFEAQFPSLTYAEDLKHFFDKVDSAVRRNELQNLKPFVAKPRGKRDPSEAQNSKPETMRE